MLFLALKVIDWNKAAQAGIIQCQAAAFYLRKGKKCPFSQLFLGFNSVSFLNQFGNFYSPVFSFKFNLPISLLLLLSVSDISVISVLVTVYSMLKTLFDLPMHVRSRMTLLVYHC